MTKLGDPVLHSHVTDEPPAAGRAVERRTLADRLWRGLGFGRCGHDYFDDIPDDHPDFKPGCFVTEIVTHWDFRDRLRILVSGRTFTIVSHKSDVIVNRVMSRSNVSVLPPEAKG